MNFTNRTILITGGNSGIGQALAEALQAHSNRIIITGRNPASLNAALERNPAMTGYTLDVTDPAALEAFAAQVLADHPALDAVILNAGIMETEDYAAAPVALGAMERTIATNLVAPIRLAAATESRDCSPRDGVRTLVAFGRAERPESELLFILFGKRRGVCVGMGR